MTSGTRTLTCTIEVPADGCMRAGVGDCGNPEYQRGSEGCRRGARDGQPDYLPGLPWEKAEVM